jgi:hypothetical protein
MYSDGYHLTPASCRVLLNAAFFTSLATVFFDAGLEHRSRCPALHAEALMRAPWDSFS